MVRNKQVAISLAMFVGCIIGNLCYYGGQVQKIAPLEWQNGISNKTFSRIEKATFKKENPGKTLSWINSEIRRKRKQFTMDLVNLEYNINVIDDDCGDAVAIGHYWVNK